MKVASARSSFQFRPKVPKFKMGNYVIICEIIILTFVPSGGSVQEGRTPFTREQMLLLKTIKLLGEQGGLSESEWSKVDTFDEEVCYDKDCLQSAVELLSNANFTVDPCSAHTWHAFVCTKKLQSDSFPNQLQLLYQRTRIQTLDLLMKSSGSEDDFLFKEARQFFLNCNPKSRNDEEDIKYILNFTSTYGGWPMITNQVPPKDFPWLGMVADQNRVDGDGWLAMLLEVEQSDTGGIIPLKIGRTYFSYTVRSIDEFNKTLTSMQETGRLNRSLNLSQLAPTFKYLTEFSLKVISLLEPNTTATNLTIPQLQEATDVFYLKKGLPWKTNWTMFFSRVLSGSGIEMNSTHPNISVPVTPLLEMVSRVEAVMNSDDAEGRMAIVNGLYINSVIFLLLETTGVADGMTMFAEDDSDLETGGSQCYKETTEAFGYSLGKSYLKEYFNDAQITPQINEMTTNIMSGMMKFIAGHQLSNKTNEFLYDKVRDMKINTGQPNWLREPGKLEEFYRGLNISRNGTAPQNFMEVNSFLVAKKRGWAHRVSLMKNITELPVYDYDWNSYLGTIQTTTVPSNEIQLGAGLIQEPLFGRNRPGFMNYAGIGIAIAHEVGHMFETRGRKFDKYGKPGEFWDQESIDKYDLWVNETVKFYKSFPLGIPPAVRAGLDSNKTTTDDDIADIVGVSAAFFGYEEYLQHLEKAGLKEKVLPGLKSFSPQKLFFMKYGTLWCENINVQAQLNRWLYDNHSGGNRRGMLPFWRSREFKDAFKCEVVEGPKSEDK